MKNPHHNVRRSGPVAVVVLALSLLVLPFTANAAEGNAETESASAETTTVHLPDSRQHTPLVGGRKGLIVTSTVFFLASAFMVVIMFRISRGSEARH